MLLSNLDLLATAPGGVARLRELILTLAVQGKLVPQDLADEPASALLQRVANGKVARSPKVGKADDESDASAAPYKLPMSWAWAQLGHVVENMGSGWSPACEEGERTDPTKWAVLRTTAVQLNEYRPREHKVVPAKLTPRPDIEVKNGDVLITRAGPLNRVGVSCWVNDTPSRLMLSDKIVRFHAVADEMLPAYIVLALNAGWTKAQIESAKTGMAASQVNISQTDLKALWLPVCSKAEQARIVTRVEELMRVCDALEAKGQLEATQHAQLVSTLLGTLTASSTPEELAENWQRVAQHFDLLLDRPEAIDTLEQTLLQLAVRGLLVPQDSTDEPASTLLARIRTEKDHLIAEGKIKRNKPLPPITDEEKPFELPVGWEWARLGEIMLISSGVTLGRRTAIPSPVALPYLRVANVQRGHLSLSSMKEIVIDQSELARFQLRSGDLLITEGGDWDKVGRTAIWRDELKSCLHQNHVFKARGISTDWNSVWAELYLNSAVARAYFASSAKQTTNLASINMTQLKGCAFPVPPLAEQSRIVIRVTALRGVCADLRQRLKAAQVTQSHLAQALVESSNAL